MADASAIDSAALPLVPRPRRIDRCAGTFAIDAATRVAVDDVPETRAVAVWIARWLGLRHIDPIAAGAPDPDHGIVLRLGAGVTGARDPSIDPPKAIDDESYTLDVDPKRVVLRAKWPAGLFYGAQTLAQLAGVRRVGAKDDEKPSPKPAPCVHIEDSPTYPFRSMHLDVARHFFDRAIVERYIDLLAFYRFNVFHFHLTDDQGFRIEIDGHPELTGVHPGAFFTREQARGIVAYAKERFVTVVPEIEMPGHARAILVSHPELSCTGKKLPLDAAFGVVHEDVLCAGNEQTHVLVDAILSDVVKTFPSHLVHIGGDEVPKTRWKNCPKCRAKMAKEKLTPEALQGVFMKRAAGTLERLGRRPAVWDEALDPSLPKDALVFAWQGLERGSVAAQAGHDVVLVPYPFTYLNTRQSMSNAEPAIEGFTPWPKVRSFDPGKGPHVLGAGGALWSERITTRDHIDTMAMPRLAALAEALWTGASNVTEADFIDRFRAQRPVLDASGIQYFIEPPLGVPEKKVFLDGQEATIAITAPALFPDGVVRVTTDSTDPTEQTTPFTPQRTRRSTNIAAALFLPGGRRSPVVRGRFEAQAPRPAYQGATFAGVKYTYFEEAVHTLPKLDGLKPKKTGTLPAITLDPSFRKEGYVVRYESFYEAAIDGVYRFTARADDGVRVIVDGEVVVEDDGEHEARDASGEIALAKGPHRVEVLFFQSRGDAELSVSVAISP